MPVQSLGVISVNIWSILISLCNLLIIYLIVKKLLFAPIYKVLDKRNEEVSKVYTDAEESLSSANEMKAFYEEKIKNANDESEEIIRLANEKAGKLHKQLIDDANQKAEYAIKRAEEEIAFEMKKAENDIKNEITEVSVILAQKIIEREINADDHSDMIDEFISDIKSSSKR